jgi:superfamily I DNA and/or RNA helicase
VAIRIYTLAKELRLDAKSLVELCDSAGIPGKASAISMLTTEEAEKLRVLVGSGGGSGMTRDDATETAGTTKLPDASSKAPGAGGIEDTPGFLFATRDHRRKALDALARLCTDRDGALHNLEALLTKRSAVAAAVTQEFAAARNRVADQYHAAVANHKQLAEAVENARTTVADFDATIARHATNDFSDPERSSIASHVDSTCNAFASSLQAIDFRLAEAERSLTDKKQALERDAKTLADARQTKDVLDGDDTTASLRASIAAAQEAAEKAHAKSLEAHTNAVASLETELRQCADRAETAAREKRDWEKKASLTPDKRTWAEWWESKTTDFSRQARNAARRQSSAEEKMEAAEQKLIAARQQVTDAPAQLAQMVAAAVSEARRKFASVIDEAIERLGPVVEALQQEISALAAQIESLTDERSQALEGQRACVASETHKAAESLRSQTIAKRATAAQALTDAESKLASAPAAPESLEELLAEHAHNEETEVNSRQRDLAESIAKARKRLADLESSLARRATRLGISSTGTLTPVDIQRARSEVTDDPSSLHGSVQSVAQPGPRVTPGRARTLDSAPVGAGAATTVQNFYIDLFTNEEQVVSFRAVRRYVQGHEGLGDFRPAGEAGLEAQLRSLHRQYEGSLFPNWNGRRETIVEHFRNLFFPNAMSGEFFIANVSLNEAFPVLTIRPAVIGPRLAAALPPGVSLAVLCHLNRWWMPGDRPLLTVHGILDILDSDPRDFEQRHRVNVFSEQSAINPDHVRSRVLCTQSFCESLPPISRITQQELTEWREYLVWKRALIAENLDGLRFVDAEITPDGLVHFTTVALDEAHFQRCARHFRKDELNAFPLNYSEDPWTFTLSEEDRGSRAFALGEHRRNEPQTELPATAKATTPWPAVYVVKVTFQLSDDDLAMIDSEADDRRIAVIEKLQRRVPASGFLSLSVVGDRVLLERQERGIQSLQTQSGYSPFLTSYLFNIKAARLPEHAEAIGEDEWSRDDLNPDQKNAVLKMISAPDLALVQGPPGTGKTTMIAESIWQFCRRGKTVLVASQANTAVENALERLARAPAIRAVRLGKKAEKDKPFHEDRVIRTYYDGIASRCRSRSLDAWNDRDAEIRRLSQLLTALDDLRDDAIAERNTIEKLLTHQRELQLEQDRLARDAAAARSVGDQREALAGFCRFLPNEADWRGDLPETVRRHGFEAVVEPLNRLRDVGIALLPPWDAFDALPAQRQSAALVEIISHFRRLSPFRKFLMDDLRRLESGAGSSILGPEQAARLAALENEKTLVLTQLTEVGNESKLDDFRRIENEIKEIRRNGAGLDRDVYQQVFNIDSDPPASWAYTNPAADRREVLDSLGRALAALSLADQAFETGLASLAKCANDEAMALATRPESVPDIAGIDATIRDVAAQLDDARNRLAGKLQRLHERMGEASVASDPADGDPLHAYSLLRQTLAENLEDLQSATEESRGFRDAWSPVIEQWIEDLDDPKIQDRDQDPFLDTYLKSCNVVGITCTENLRTLERVDLQHFDVAIIDEVSKATPPELVLPMSRARTAILVGDHRQLPPLFKESSLSFSEVVTQDEEDAGNAAAASPPETVLTPENVRRFKRMVTASYFKEHFENAPDGLKAALVTQYRMHPQIMGVINHFYEGRLGCGLQDPDSARAHRMSLTGPTRTYLQPDQHVLWIDAATDPSGRACHESKDRNSKVNHGEAALIAKVVCDIERACRELGYGSAGKARKLVGIVTFYGRQVNVIRNAIQRAKSRLGIDEFRAVHWDVNTVDRYQGQERPIVLVSMVRNPPSGRLSRQAHTAQFERVNVAYSRAQELLVVFGSRDIFTRYPVTLPNLDTPGEREVPVYKLIIDQIRMAGGLLTPADILDQATFESLQDSRRRAPASAGQSRRPRR